jgi:predicted nucleic acid-binding protein
MSGKEILVDTNILIYLLNGDDTIAQLLNGKKVYISFITELELIGYNNVNGKQEKQIQSLLSECVIIQLNEKIKHTYSLLRKKHSLKLADSVVVATAIATNLPLISADKRLRIVKELDLLIYNP